MSSAVAIVVVGLCGNETITTFGSLARDRFGDRPHAAGRERCDDARAGQSWSDSVDWVGGRRHDDGVAALDEHPHQVREPLLCADRARDLRFRVERDAERALVVLGDGVAQLRDPSARGVPVVGGLGGRLLQLRDGDLGRRDVRVAEAEVDHVAPVAPQLTLQLVDGGEDVRREVVDSAKLHFGKYCRGAHGS